MEYNLNELSSTVSYLLKDEENRSVARNSIDCSISYPTFITHICEGSFYLAILSGNFQKNRVTTRSFNSDATALYKDSVTLYEIVSAPHKILQWDLTLPLDSILEAKCEPSLIFHWRNERARSNGKLPEHFDVRHHFRHRYFNIEAQIKTHCTRWGSILDIFESLEIPRNIVQITQQQLLSILDSAKVFLNADALVISRLHSTENFSLYNWLTASPTNAQVHRMQAATEYASLFNQLFFDPCYRTYPMETINYRRIRDERTTILSLIDNRRSISKALTHMGLSNYAVKASKGLKLDWITREKGCPVTVLQQLTSHLVPRNEADWRALITYTQMKVNNHRFPWHCIDEHSVFRQHGWSGGIQFLKKTFGEYCLEDIRDFAEYFYNSQEKDISASYFNAVFGKADLTKIMRWSEQYHSWITEFTNEQLNTEKNGGKIISQWLVPTETIDYKGYYFLPLSSEPDLFSEGAAMTHCIGSYGFKCKVSSSIYSIRKDYKALAIMELTHLSETMVLICQLRGPENDPVPKELIATAAAFVKDLNSGYIDNKLKDVWKEKRVNAKKLSSLGRYYSPYNALTIYLSSQDYRLMKKHLRNLSTQERCETLQKLQDECRATSSNDTPIKTTYTQHKKIIDEEIKRRSALIAKNRAEGTIAKRLGLLIKWLINSLKRKANEKT